MREPGYQAPITYWPPAGENRYGVKTTGTPILLYGRWEDRSEEVETIGGETIVSQSMAFVNQDVLVGGFLARGDLLAVADPKLSSAAQEIKDFQQIPDLRNVSTTRKAVM